MADEELKAKIVEWFEGKSKGGKKKFYVADVVGAFKDDYAKRDIKKAINQCTVDQTIMYWSSGSTTMLVLAENFKE